MIILKLIRRNMLGFMGSLMGTLIGVANGGRVLWCFVVPPILLALMVILDWSVSRAMKKPIL
jgi:hypothetical protein